MRVKKRFLLLPTTFGVAIAATFFNTAGALTNTQVSGISGVQYSVSTSFNGRYIAFLSSASTLVSGDTNNAVDAFVDDTSTGTITRISVSSAGDQANAPTSKVILSGNGRYALMTSQAGNLASGGSYMAQNVYLRDLRLGQTYLIAAGDDGSGLDQYAVAVSEDGRFAYYVNAYTHALYMYDRQLATTTRVDTDASGTPGNSGVGNTPDSTSCDGRFVVFSSASSNLVSGDTNGKADVFLVDSMNGHAITDITLGANNKSMLPVITCDGNFVLFYSLASNLVSGDTNSAMDLFEYDVANGTTQLVDLDPSGNQYGSLPSSTGGLNPGGGQRLASMDGRYVVFTIDIDGSGPLGQTEFSGQVFLRDTKAGTTTALSPIGSNTFAGDDPAITYDGRTVYYTYQTTYSQNLSMNVYSATSYL
ncbi:MAG TPA: hypothetical protein VLE99_06030 [Candidatus Saccharimonadales bacterium]|nr:hypothetical protein [Candidatus Saccharimonadales bacterium]